MIARGFLVAAVNYRLFSKDPQGGLHNAFPVMIEDVKCAVRYLRAHATQYSLDPKRFGAWGWSAGGHLVSLLGTSNEGDFATRQLSLRTQLGFRPSLTCMDPQTSRRRGYCYVANSARKYLITIRRLSHRAGPINYVSHDDPPFLIIQGDQDTLVPPGQSEELLEKLQAASVSARW